MARPYRLVGAPQLENLLRSSSFGASAKMEGCAIAERRRSGGGLLAQEFRLASAEWTFPKPERGEIPEAGASGYAHHPVFG